MIAKFATAVVDKLSWTVAEKEKIPVAVGVPEICPLELSDRPLGSAPLVTDHVYGGAPPVACNVCEYVTPVSPVASEVVMILSDAGRIVRLVAKEAAPDALSVTWIVKFAVAAADGVPLIWPEGLIIKPAGSAPLAMDHV